MNCDDKPLNVSELLPPRCDEVVDEKEVESLAPAASNSERRPNRNWWRFSIRALILLQLLLAIAFAFISARVHSFRQQEAIAAKFADRRFCSFWRTPAKPEWFWKPVAALTNTEAEDIYEVHIGDRPLRRAEAVEISRLRRVDAIWLTYGVVERDALQPFTTLPKLTRLDLRDAERRNLDDETLAPVMDCPKLTWLTIDSVNVTDEAIGRLASHRTIRHLDIQYAKLSLAGLRPWIAENRLTVLSIPTRLSDHEFEELSRLSSLCELRLPELNHSAVEHLATMPNLVRVEPYVAIPDEATLKAMPSRIRVDISSRLLRPKRNF